MLTENLLLMADAYKYSHHPFYPEGMTGMFSYLESRGGKFDKTCFVLLQFILKKYLVGKVITEEKVMEAETVLKQTFGNSNVFNSGAFRSLVKKHKGRLPLVIRAVPEGSWIPNGNILMSIENTDPEFPWLTNWIESLMLQVWYPTTVATLSGKIKERIKESFKKTESPEGSIPYTLNDFGFRGVSSVESALIGGAAHKVFFDGSDNVYSEALIREYYEGDFTKFSGIPATEHSIMTINGSDGELNTVKKVLETYKTGPLACVMDSFDVKRAVGYVCNDLKDLILSRDGFFVFKPDSGHIINTLAYIFEELFKYYGFTLTKTGHRVLPPQIRVIQGDGVNYDSICEIYDMMEKNKISPANLVLGMGGALLQKVDRDTQKFAFKCSSVDVNGRSIDVQKNPMEITHDNNYIKSFKKSKAGRLKLIKLCSGEFKTVRQNDASFTAYKDILQTVFYDGELVKEVNWEEVKGIADGK